MDHIQILSFRIHNKIPHQCDSLQSNSRKSIKHFFILFLARNKLNTRNEINPVLQKMMSINYGNNRLVAWNSNLVEFLGTTCFIFIHAHAPLADVRQTFDKNARLNKYTIFLEEMKIDSSLSRTSLDLRHFVYTNTQWSHRSFLATFLMINSAIRQFHRLIFKYCKRNKWNNLKEIEPSFIRRDRRNLWKDF